MPTPTFTLRLPKKTQDDIADLAKVYGAANPRAFAREILEVVTSGDLERIKGFNQRLLMRMGEQLSLRLNTAMDQAAAAAVDTLAKGNGPARNARTARKKRRRPRDRT